MFLLAGSLFVDYLVDYYIVITPECMQRKRLRSRCNSGKIDVQDLHKSSNRTTHWKGYAI